MKTLKKSSKKKPATKAAKKKPVPLPKCFELMFQEGRKIFIQVKNPRDNAEMIRRLDRAAFLGTVRKYRAMDQGEVLPPGYELEPRSPDDILILK